jgi:hypothetical protein
MEAWTRLAQKRWSNNEQVRAVVDLLVTQENRAIPKQNFDITSVLKKAYPFLTKYFHTLEAPRVVEHIKERWKESLRQGCFAKNVTKKVNRYESSQYGHYEPFGRIVAEGMCPEMFYCVLLHETAHLIDHELLQCHLNCSSHGELVSCFVEILALSRCSEEFVREWMRVREVGAFVDYLSCCGATTHAGIVTRDPNYSAAVSSTEYTQAASRVASQLTESNAIESVLAENNGHFEVIAQLVLNNNIAIWRNFHFGCMAVALHRFVHKPPRNSEEFLQGLGQLLSHAEEMIPVAIDEFDENVEKFIEIMNRPEFRDEKVDFSTCIRDVPFEQMYQPAFTGTRRQSASSVGKKDKTANQ